MGFIIMGYYTMVVALYSSHFLIATVVARRGGGGDLRCSPMKRDLESVMLSLSHDIHAARVSANG
jgi:hypothetical protein